VHEVRREQIGLIYTPAFRQSGNWYLKGIEYRSAIAMLLMFAVALHLPFSRLRRFHDVGPTRNEVGRYWRES
jgi:hypothetical protein